MSSDESEGVALQRFVAQLTSACGVYRMLNAKGEVIYVGKAVNLKRRVASYFKPQASAKVAALVKQLSSIDVTITETEHEALLLESNLIKALRPRYNVLLRDDKSYPHIFLSAHAFPRLVLHRGRKRAQGHYFGPFPSADAARSSMQLLQKLFAVRPCTDSTFRNRSRPCLQYQIGRCSAPCVGKISEQDYAAAVRHVCMVLEGKNEQVLQELAERMERASDALDFEQARVLRDHIAKLRQVQQRQAMDTDAGDVDIIAVACQQTSVCVEVLSIRHGQLLGDQAFFPKVSLLDLEASAILGQFIPQYYRRTDTVTLIPHTIIVSHELPERKTLEGVLAEWAKHAVVIQTRVRGERARWLQLAEINAKQALASQQSQHLHTQQRFAALQQRLRLVTPPQRIECFDISHTQGEATVASCVVFGSEGPIKSDYRRYTITDVTPGDDYAAMLQAVSRRYSKIGKAPEKIPDVICVDGGLGQLSRVYPVVRLFCPEAVLLAIAKGPHRKPGEETVWRADEAHELALTSDDPALHVLQHIRDEAHRFAITAHRARRAKTRRTSVLEGIPGVGPRRRQALLQHFGGLLGIKRATQEELASVPQVSAALAQRIYDALH